MLPRRPRSGLIPLGSKRSRYDLIQAAVMDAIGHESFSEHALPTLSDKVWARIAAGTSPWTTENDRLEYVGDAIMNGAIALQLHCQLPMGTAGRYSVSSFTASMPSKVYACFAGIAFSSPLQCDFRVSSQEAQSFCGRRGGRARPTFSGRRWRFIRSVSQANQARGRLLRGSHGSVLW